MRSRVRVRFVEGQLLLLLSPGYSHEGFTPFRKKHFVYTNHTYEPTNMFAKFFDEHISALKMSMDNLQNHLPNKIPQNLQVGRLFGHGT